MTTLTANCIDLNIQGNSVYAILKQLADMAFQKWLCSDRSIFLAKRYCCAKSCIPPALARGIAVPHGKSACIRQPFVLFARKSENVDWKASDGEDVNR